MLKLVYDIDNYEIKAEGPKDNQVFYRIIVEGIGQHDFEEFDVAEKLFMENSAKFPDNKAVLLECTQKIVGYAP